MTRNWEGKPLTVEDQNGVFRAFLLKKSSSSAGFGKVI